MALIPEAETSIAWSDELVIFAKLDRLNALLFARDPAIIDELWCDAGFVLMGSAVGESARTRAELAALIETLFGLPVRLSWDYPQRRIESHGDVAWLVAEGHLLLTAEAGVERKPYRLTAIFQKIGSDWRWRLYSGSEPV